MGRVRRAPGNHEFTQKQREALTVGRKIQLSQGMRSPCVFMPVLGELFLLLSSFHVGVVDMDMKT